VQLALQSRILLIISPVVLTELREALRRPKLMRKLKLRSEQTEQYLGALERSGWLLQGFPETFAYARDPDDAHYINLAIAADAKLIVSRDKDLLDLMDQRKPDGLNFHRQFPALRILDPVSFLNELAPRAERRG